MSFLLFLTSVFFFSECLVFNQWTPSPILLCYFASISLATHSIFCQLSHAFLCAVLLFGLFLFAFFSHYFNPLLCTRWTSSFYAQFSLVFAAIGAGVSCKVWVTIKSHILVDLPNDWFGRRHAAVAVALMSTKVYHMVLRNNCHFEVKG